MAYIILAG